VDFKSAAVNRIENAHCVSFGWSEEYTFLRDERGGKPLGMLNSPAYITVVGQG
jgi:hypothetical protein